MRAPIRFALRNLVFGERGDDVRAVYRLGMTSYEGLTAAGKLGLLAELAGLAHALEADFDVYCVQRGFSAAEYHAHADAAFQSRFGHRALWEAHLERGRCAGSPTPPPCWWRW